MLAIVLVLLTAVANATALVLLRKATVAHPDRDGGWPARDSAPAC